MPLPSLSQRRRVALAVVALLAASARSPLADPAAPTSASAPAPSPPAGGEHAKLEIVERVHDAGRVERGAVIEHAFVLKNTGAAPLTIDAKPGCGCTVVDFDKVIPPGGTGAVRAKLDTRMFKGDLTKSVTIDTNDPEVKGTVLELVAFVVVPIDIQPGEVMAIEGRRGEVAPVDITLDSPENTPFDIISAESNDASYSVKVAAVPAKGGAAPKPKSGTLASGASRYALTVSVAKDVSPGRGGVQILVKTTHPKAPEVTIQLYPNILGDISLNPERVTLRLSPTSPPETRTQHVAVRAVPGVTFHVTDVQSSNPLLKAAFKAVSVGSEYDVTITYEGPPLTTVVDGHVSIVTDHPDQAVLPVAVYAFPEPLPASLGGPASPGAAPGATAR